MFVYVVTLHSTTVNPGKPEGGEASSSALPTSPLFCDSGWLSSQSLRGPLATFGHACKHKTNGGCVYQTFLKLWDDGDPSLGAVTFPHPTH